MYCPKCGTENQDDAVNCIGCGSPFNQGDVPENDGGFTPNNGGFTPNTGGFTPNVPNVPNYLVWSILVTILCCLPLGIPAIIFSSQVDGKLRTGDYQGAVQSSKKAKTFIWLSFGLGLAVGIIYLIIMVLGVASEM